MVAICLLAGVLCVSVFAADTDAPAPDPAKGVVLRISAEKSGKQYPVVVADHTNFKDGWNAAMKLASDFRTLNANGYKHIIVDIYSDWKATKGEFSNSGTGFNWDAIYFPSDVNVTLNLNGHTVDRGLTEYQYNGEVMYIDSNAKVTINNGTIKGGFSCNGAGGIHVNGADVTLNDVNLIGNTVEDDDGAAIALHSATLTMNGGSMSNNVLYSTVQFFAMEGSHGVLYVGASTATLNNVTFSGNVAKHTSTPGLLITAVRGNVEVNDCVFENNGLSDGAEDKDYVTPLTLIESYSNSNVFIKNSEFKNNCTGELRWGLSWNIYKENSLISTYFSKDKTCAGNVDIESCTFTGNQADYLICFVDSAFTMTDCTATDNISGVLYVQDRDNNKQIIKNCTFNNNVRQRDDVDYKTFHFYAKSGKSRFDLTFIDCDFGDSTFNDKTLAKFTNSSNVVGSVFNEGSVTMIVSLAALVASVTSIALTVVSNKKNKAVTANDTETGDEE